MSRIGKQPIVIPAKVKVEVKGGNVLVEGPKGKLSQFIPARITAAVEKDKVIVSVVFRGRELAHIDEGQRVMKNILVQLEEVGKVETPPQQMGKRLVCTVAPR